MDATITQHAASTRPPVANSEPRFRDAFDAVRFALCYSSQQYGTTPLAKCVDDTPIGRGMGLVGMDGAAQAGAIRRHMETLPESHLAVLVARAAPHSLPCTCGAPCCLGTTPNPERCAAVEWLTDAAAAYASGLTHRQARRAIIEKLFGAGGSLADIAAHCDVPVHTISRNNTAIRRWLDGDTKAGEPGATQAAWNAIGRRLAMAGLIDANATDAARAGQA
ncbi:DNA-binding protein [Paraburkholderia tagetis]|uniref:DNA-binding protein n=1 Tax=Paraburkholderia tagetis TaxID=2913261 RepID=A0A9X1RKH3_9BURK|nr:DNA-binding protein [Paraburkholderia tagetis]MCG5073033.1 DNA-binding protein [Paraburkholderia tagetis]